MIKILLCDDNANELKSLSSLLETYCHERKSNSEIKLYTFSSGALLLDAVSSGKIRFDIVLLDILMPGENGMQIAKKLRKIDPKCEIIFLTTSSEYAVESYEVKAYNYLLKPVQKEKLFSVMDSCIDDIEAQKNSGFVLRIAPGTYTKILYSELVYGEAMRKTVILYLADGTTVSSVMTFTELENILHLNPDFVKPHRSYIVNMRYIKSIRKKDLILHNDNIVPVSKTHYHDVTHSFFDFVFLESGKQADK